MSDCSAPVSASARAPASVSSRTSAEAGQRAAGALWLAIVVEDLALVAQLPDGVEQTPCALTRSERGRETIHQVNPPAARRGVSPGQTLATALARIPGLVHQAYRAECERQALERLAQWAYGYSGELVLHPPCTLLLEAGASLHLFGGWRALYRRLRTQLDQLGYRYRLAGAATLEGAQWLARSGRSLCPRSPRALHRALADLPLTVAITGGKQRAQCRALGLSTLEELWRLPRDGLAKRFGTRLLEDIDCALGRRSRPRERWHPPPGYDACLDLPAPARDAQPLVFAAHRLLKELALTLQARQCAIPSFSLAFTHEDRQPPTRLEIRLLTPGRDSEHWRRLLTERLQRLVLASPVIALRLRCATFLPAPGQTVDLFAEPVAATSLPVVLERIRARLGDASVRTPMLRADHRPERAMELVEQAGPEARTPSLRAARPLRLLGRPRLIPDPPQDWALSCRERIETGWWDGNDISRDYYVATLPDGRRWWVFQERRGARQWYLHGLFV